jgi:broad specificity phosphatase PhoE
VAGGGSGGPTTTARGGGSGGRSSTAGIGSGGKTTGGTTADAGSAAGGTAGTDGGAVGKGLTVYYIRHAEVVANTVDAAQMSADNADTFTALGERQVAALTTYLQGLGVTPDAVLVSPAPRSQKTIEPYLVAAGITGEIWIELNEIAGLPSTGAPLPSTPKYYTFYKATLAVQNLVFRDPSTTAFWQNDTYEAELLMVTTAKNELLKRYGGSGKTIIVVGHAVAGSALIGLLRGNDLMGGLPTTGSSAVYILNTGVMRLTQDVQTGTFKLDGKNINNPTTK